jgi:hypothetical protein
VLALDCKLLAARDRKIKLLREYLNVVATAKTMLLNGLADIPA